MTERVTEPSAATWLGFVLMCLGMFMAILDIQVVATSLPTIQDALAISRDAMSWLQTAYLIAEIIAIPLTGWLTRVLTLRWLFVIAISLFTLASVGCAFSGSFPTLVSFRVVQGFAGGALIPAVFSAVFLLFPIRLHPIATTMAGIMAVLAPTVGPVVGGWITETWSWHWLFLINVAPGIMAAAATPFLLPREKPRFADLATLDGSSLALLAVSLASLEIGLKQAPHDGWLSPLCALLFLLSAAAATGFAARTLKAKHPVVELLTLKNVSFAIGCALSFCLGVGLFGSVYLMPVFLAYVRRHDAFEIGTIMLVTGVSQLVTAPIAGALESRLDPRWLSAAGFGLFALGLGCSALQSRVADFDEMFWPQVLRGGAHRWTRRGFARPSDLRRHHGGAGDRARSAVIHPPAPRCIGRHRRGLSSPDGREGGVRAQRQRSLGATRLCGAARTAARSVREAATAAHCRGRWKHRIAPPGRNVPAHTRSVLCGACFPDRKHLCRGEGQAARISGLIRSRFSTFECCNRTLAAGQGHKPGINPPIVPCRRRRAVLTPNLLTTARWLPARSS